MGIYNTEAYLGGVVGRITCNILYISLFAVELENHRLANGVRLIAEIEKIVREHHCQYVTVTSQDFQYLAFYQKNVFLVIGQLGNSPIEGTTKYYLNKKPIKSMSKTLIL